MTTSMMVNGYEIRSNSIIQMPLLTRANMMDAVFEWCIMDMTCAVGADMSGAKLNGTRMRESNLRNVRLVGAEISNALFNASSMHGANLTRAVGIGTEFNYCRAGGADFTDADMPFASFRGADLQGVSFRGADLTAANFHNTILDNADFTGANLEDADFSDALWNEHTVWPEGFTPPVPEED